MSAAVSTSLADRLADLGDIDPSRIRCDPAPGQATVEDLLRIRQFDGRRYELVDSTLVEKIMGWKESLLAGVLLQWLLNFLDENTIGVATGADGMSRLFGTTVRGPDVAFVSWARLPGGRIPTEPIPDLVPDFVIEVLSKGNTRGEMSRKRREYFQAGVGSLLMVDPRNRTVAIYQTADQVAIACEGEIIEAGPMLPGWTVDTAALFAKLDQQAPSP